MTKAARFVQVALLLTALSPGTVFAQATTGSISGTIADQSGAILPGVHVVVIHPDTGVERTQTSDERGRYRVLNLAPGAYLVVAELPGFAKAVHESIVVAIGRDLIVDVQMSVSGLAESISVVGETASVDLGVATAGGVVTTRQIGELPLNGRSFMQLATLQPGVVVSRGTPRVFTGGFGATQLSIGGARPEHTGYLMDGTNIADISDKAPSSVAGVLLGVDTVQEFSVQTHGYSAEFGRAAGGVLSAVTRSGGNAFRGSAFEFTRNSALDARNFFDVADPPPFERHQFGGTLGGPIVRNRVFFFGSYEGLRDRRSVTRYARLPNAQAHAGLVPGAGGVLQNVGVHPQARPYLDLLFPIPGGRDFGDGTAELAHAHQEPTDQHFYVAKLDWQASPSDAFMFRFSRDWADAILSQEHPLFVETIGTEMRFVTAQHQHLFTANLLNVVRVAANRTSRDNDVLPTVEIPTSLYFSEDPHFGAINIIGISLAGSTSTIPVTYRQDIFQLSNTLTWHRGSHTWKYGLDWHNYHFDGTSYSRYGGEFRFRNLTEFLTLRRSATAQADRFTGNLPGTDTYRQMRQHYVAFFAHDDWRLSDRLSVAAGLRYEFVTDPEELNGQVAGLRDLSDLESGPGGVVPGTPLFDNPSKRSLAPRLGVSWSPDEERTSVRGGWGIFYQPLTVSFYRGTVFRIYPYFAGVDIRQPAVFGPGMADVLAGPLDPSQVQKRSEFIEYDIKQPFVQQWHINVRRDLARGVSADVAYLGSKGANLPFYGDPNSVPAEYLADGTKRLVPGAGLPYPSWGRIRTRTTTARSIYHGLTVGVQRRSASGLLLQGAYTLGNARDSWSGGQSGNDDFENGAGGATDWFDPEYEFGPSNFDVRHSFVINTVYPVPWGRGSGGLAGVLASGWHLGAVLQFTSGIPFTPYVGYDRLGNLQSDADQQKPNLAAPVRYPRTAEQWFDPSAFGLPAVGVFGNAGRNSLRAPGVKLADLSVFKNVPMGRTVLQVRLEAFNAFNWVNLGVPAASVLFNPDGTPFAGAGRITATSTPARQVQLGIKWMF
jgi:hypothetical protein